MVSAWVRPDIAPRRGFLVLILTLRPTGAGRSGTRRWGSTSTGRGAQKRRMCALNAKSATRPMRVHARTMNHGLEVSVALADEAAARFRPRDVPGPPDSSSAVSG